MTVTDDKSFNGSIDKRNNTSTLQSKAAGRVLKRTTDEVLIPYVDKYRLTKLGNGAGMSGSVTLATAWTKSSIIETIMTANAAMSNQLVPDTGRVLYISYTDAIKLKLADQVVGIDKLGEKCIVNGVCGKIDKCQVRIVPDAYMPQVDIPTGTGDATAKHQALFLIVKTGVAVAPKKIETFRVLTDHPDIDGHVVQGRMLHDCFVLNTKKNGIYVGYNPATIS